MPDIIQRIKAAENNPVRSAAISAWDKYIRYYDSGAAGSSDPEYNLIYIFGSALIPNLVFQNPYIICTPQTRRANLEAQLWEGIDNFLVSAIGLREVMEQAILACYCTNVGAVEIGWDSVGDAIHSDDDSEFPRISFNDARRRRNFPWITSIDPRKLILPSGFTDIRNVPWYAKEVCISEVEAAKIAELRPLKGNIPYNYEASDKKNDKEPLKYLKFYIQRSQETQKVTWLTTDGKVLFEQNDPLQREGLPLVFFNFNLSLDTIYGVPDVQRIESQYLEGNELRADGRWQRKNATTKFLYDSSMVTNKDVTRLLSGEVMPAIGIEVPAGKSLRDCVLELQPSVQREYMEYSSFLNQDAERLLGFGPNQMGVTATGRRTKYEMQQVAQNNFLRLSLRRDKVSNAIGGIFTKINSLVEKNWQHEQVVPVLGPDAAVHYVKTTLEDRKAVNSKISTKVSIDSLTPASVERRREDMKEIMAILANFAPEQTGSLFPLIKSFISLFDWGEARNLLEQKEEEETPQQFAQTETSPEAVGNNLQRLTPMMRGQANEQTSANLGGLQPQAG
jgi:hypothetical protein